MWLSAAPHEAANQAACAVGVMWPYFAVQRCSWPGAACWPLSSSRPWGPVSCECLKCAEPGHRQRWWESGPACWNSSACLRAHPGPGRPSKTKHRCVCQLCDSMKIFIAYVCITNAPKVIFLLKSSLCSKYKHTYATRLLIGKWHRLNFLILTLTTDPNICRFHT